MRQTFAIVLVFCCSATLPAQVKIVYDTDMDTDCDDAGALAILHALADRGEAEILATVVSSRYRWSVPCVEAINRYYGRADLPIGAPKTEWADTARRGSRYAKQIAEQYATRLKSNGDAPDAVDVYRQVLAAQDNGSVVIVTVGYLTNLRDLLASKPDAISRLDGPALVRQKVSRWVCMGGRYPEQLNPGVFGNFKPDPSSAVIAVRDWPGPIYFTGLGDKIQTGGRLHETPADNPVRRVYKLYLRERKTRPSWDPIGVLFGVRSEADFWKTHTGGRNHIFENGTNQWRDGPETNHHLVQLKPNAEELLRETLDQLMVQGTTGEPKPSNHRQSAAQVRETHEDGKQRTHFAFEKRGKLISRPTGMSKPGPYYTTLVKMDHINRFPFEYALYFSTDHDRGKGGIWLYVCSGSPTDADSWKSYDQAVADGSFDYLRQKPASNPIFVDSVQGRQTETPHANIIDGTVYMTYHNAGAGHSQSTLLSTSSDGVNFTRINGDGDSVILDYDPEQEVGDGHTGYFRWRPNPFPGLDYKYVGYSLHGGGDDFHGAMWASNNAVNWNKLQVFDSIEGHAVDGDRIVRRRAIDPNSITALGNGEYAAICSIGHRSSGGRPRVLEFYEIYLADDGKTLTRKGRKILGNGPPGAYDEEELDGATTVVVGDTWHLIYVGTKGKARENTVMGAVGKFDASTPRNPVLPLHDQTRDLRQR